MVLTLQIVNGAITSSPSFLSSLKPLASSSSSTRSRSLFPPLLSKVSAPTRVVLVACCSRVCQQEVAVVGLQSHDDDDDANVSSDKHPPTTASGSSDGDGALLDDDDDDDGNQSSSDGVSGIRVPRPTYISIPKSRLVEAIVSQLFHSQLEADQFLRLSKCLDSILLAQHKCILEDLRVDYDDLTNSLDIEAALSQGSYTPKRKPVFNGKKSFALGSSQPEEDESPVDKIDQSQPEFSGEMDSTLGGSFSKNAGTTPSKRY